MVAIFLRDMYNFLAGAEQRVSNTQLGQSPALASNFPIFLFLGLLMKSEP